MLVSFTSPLRTQVVNRRLPLPHGDRHNKLMSATPEDFVWQSFIQVAGLQRIGYSSLWLFGTMPVPKKGNYTT